MSLLLFYVGENGYAIESRYILRIIPRVALKKVASLPPYIPGFANLGGKAIPIVDFCLLIEKRAALPLLSSRIILIQDPRLESTRVLGILGEKVEHLLRVEVDELSQTSLSALPYFTRMFSRNNEIIQYLDIEKFFHFLSADLFHDEKEDGE